MISKHTPEGVYIYASPACRSLLGYEPEDLIGHSAYDFFHPQDLDAIRKSHSTILETPDTSTVEYRIRRKDCSYTWFETTSKTLRDEATEEVKEIIAVSRDITERKRGEDATFFQARLLDQVQAAVIATDLDGIVTHWNTHAERLYGYSCEEVLGRNIAGLTVGPTETNIAREIMEQLRNGESWEGEFTVQCKDGSTFTAYVVDSLIRDAQGRAVGVVGVSTDITERKRSEENLRRSNRRIVNILESITDAFFAVDGEWKFTYVNRQAEQVLKRSREELLGKNIWEEFPEAVGSTFYVKYHEAVESRMAAHFEGFYPPLDHCVEVWAYPSSEGLAVYFQDITERKEAEEELRFRKALLEAQTETSIDGILVVSPDGEMISYNQRFVEMWNMPEEVLTSRSDEAALEVAKDKAADSQGFMVRVNYLYEHPGEESREEIPLKDGRTFDRYSAPVRGTDGTYYGRVWYFRDITRRKRAEQALLEIREAERRRIARDLHDAVLQDLSGTLQGLQAMQVEFDSADRKADLRRETEALRRAVRGLRGAVHDLRHEPELSFVKAVESLVEYNRQATPERQIRLNVQEDFPQELPETVKAELLRTVQEALTNARRHSGARWTGVRLRTDQDKVCIEVIDDGLGFDPESVHKGLGLLGMQERVTTIGADLEIQSDIGKGTIVRVTIPTQALPAKEMSREEPG
jgi:PAS domain S-box-containing protein